MTTNTEYEEKKERPLSELLNMDYCDMTDDEIGRVIDYKAGIKARDDEFAKRMELAEETARAQLLIASETAKQSVDNFHKLIEPYL